ncbi:MAG: OmpA family protein, partial [Flavobacteriales bacterium]|nr:OmpA family protein [Flavobacteriales bacterium]
YQNFIYNFSYNSKTQQAKDSVLFLGVRYEIISALESYINNYYDKREYAIEALYPIFTSDGEQNTLNLFTQRYGTPGELYYTIKDDLYNSSKSSSLLLNLPFDRTKEDEYKNFIVNSAPSELSFVCLQRLLSYNIRKKRWNSALSIMDEFDTLFTSNQNYKNLKKTLEKEWNESIVSKSVSSKINRSTGDEYGAVISADNKYLYFCGNGRSGNIGGEDIFVSRRSNSWRTPTLIKDLSTIDNNEATVNISTDGTTLILFREGKLLSSEKTSNGWSNPIELPYSINSGIWNSDATISSNGEALIFSSVREGSKNLYTENENNYHGDNQYPSDIFISLKDENDNWGEPFNIGDSINTKYTERSPFLHPDMKTLYFSSDGHGGMGKLDVFMSTRLYDSCWTCWSEPINLGKEINTIESDWGYKISTDGKTAFFTKEENNYKKNSLLLLLDISGSMQGEKVESLKEAAKDVCRNAINNNSKVSIMAFTGSNCNFPIDTILNFTNNINDVDNYINSLYADGRTPMYNAYILASKYIHNNADKNSNKMILLMTDGNSTDEADCGRTLDDALKLIRQNRHKVQTQTIAFMVDSASIAFSDLNKISEYTGGELYYVENTASLKSSFSKATSSLYGINTSSTRKEIYTINLPDHLRPDLVATVEGKLLDSKNEPIDAIIRFEDLESNKLIGKIKNNPEDGSYFIVLPLGKLYGLYIDKEDYFPISNNLDLRNENKIIEIENNIPLYTFEEMIEEGIAVPINNIFFDSGKSDLKNYSIPELIRISKIIIENNLTVELSGHTDDIDTEEFNLQLSEDRANAVKEFLVNNGCDENKIITIGYGESKPLNGNKNTSERKKNRRVEFKFVK